MLYKDKSLMTPRRDRVPFWIRKKHHTKLRKLAFKHNKPMFIFADEAIAEWLINNYK